MSIHLNPSCYCDNYSFRITGPQEKGRKECFERLKAIALVLKHEIPDPRLNRFHCPIAQELPQEMVQTECGHLFEKTLIAEYQKNTPEASCPSCRGEIGELRPPPVELSARIKELQGKEPVPTIKAKKENPEIAESLEKAISLCVEKEEYALAEKLLYKLFEASNSVKKYSFVENFYRNRGLMEKARLAGLYFCMYVLEQNHVKTACRGLRIVSKNYPELASKIDPIFCSLKLSRSASYEKIERARKKSLNWSGEEKKFLYSQIALYFPGAFNLYPDLAKEPVSEVLRLRWKAQAVDDHIRRGMDVLQRNELEEPFLLENLIHYPPALEEYLLEECPIWGGMKRDSHIVVPLFPLLYFQFNDVPRNLHNLNQFTGRINVKDKFLLKEEMPEKSFCWAAMTKRIFPGTRNMSVENAEEVLKVYGYEIPDAADAPTALVWHKNSRGEACFQQEALRCRAGSCMADVKCCSEQVYVSAAAQSPRRSGDFGYAGIRFFS